MEHLDPPARSSSRTYLLLVGIALLLVGGVAAILYFGESQPPTPPPVGPPVTPAEEPLPKSPTELLRDLSASTAAGNRPRLIRLLTDDWAVFVTWTDGEVSAVTEAKRKAVEAVRADLGEDSARLLRELPDVPSPWPLFDGIDWAKAVAAEVSPLASEVRVAGHTFQAEATADGTWRLRPGSAESALAMKGDVATALAPIRETYRRVEDQAKSGRFTADSFPAVLTAVRHLAVTTAHPPTKSR